MSNIIQILKNLVFNKSFLFGIALAVGMFSHYIFGNDNLAEQMTEMFVEKTTGQQIDFTPEQEVK
jgi:hypothetical protein